MSTKLTFSQAHRQHRHLTQRMDAIYAAGGDAACDGPAYVDLEKQVLALKSVIVLAPVRTAGELNRKWQILKGDDCDFLEPDGSCAMRRLLVEILQRDVDAIGQTIPELAAEAIRPRRLVDRSPLTALTE